MAMKPIRPNSLQGKIVTGIEAGAELSIAEWAEELHTQIPAIRDSLRILRKKGYLFYPLKSLAKKGEQGKVVSILRKNSYILELTERHNKTYLDPQLESAFRIMEMAIPKFPQMHEPMKARLSHLVNMLSGEQRQLTVLAKEAHANPVSSN